MDAHHNEYLAAVAGMQETYGAPHPGRCTVIDGELTTTWGVGDSVKFRHDEHGEIRGTVIEVLIEDGMHSTYHVAAHVPGRGRQHFAVHNRDMLIF